MNRSIRSNALALAACLITGAGCTSINPNADGGGPLNCNGDFGTTDAARQLTAFLRAASSFSQTAAELDTTLSGACRGIATDLGAMPGDLMGDGSPGTDTQTACTRAAALIEAEMRAVRAAAGVSVYVEYQPPACEVNVMAYNNCVAECDVTYMPGMAQVTCEGGELRGTCSGSCTGTCAAMVSGSCTGACEGTCMGGCMGTCQGTCDGTCSVHAADGSCNGACMGTCQGTCSAMCTGSCMGQCVAMASATCMGECRGMCSVAFTEPRCTGRVVPPMANADCRASCDTRINATAMCTPARVAVRITGTLSADLMTRYTRLKTTLEAHYTDVLSAAAKIRRLAEAGVALVDSAQRVPNAVASVGVTAAACAADAANQIRVAVPRVQASVMVTVSVSASVSAQ